MRVTENTCMLVTSTLTLRNKMSRFRRFHIVERRTPSYFIEETAAAIFAPPETHFLDPASFPAFPISEDLLQFPPPFFFNEFDTFVDLIQIGTARVTRRVGLGDLQLHALCNRVSDVELGLERLLREEKASKKKKKKTTKKLDDKKYYWTAEIETAGKHQKCKWSSESKGGEEEKSYKCTTQIKGKGGPIERTYTIEVASGGDCVQKKKTKVKENGKSAARTIQIEEPSDHGAMVLRKAFTKRLEKKKGKSKELSPQDAAVLIQMSFRTYLIRRSQVLCALRELAIAKNKLKEIRVLFNNFSYHRRISHDAEERQRFCEKIIVLLLTVDAIEGADSMVRSAKKAMVDEVEAMLDVVDPQAPAKSSSMKRRTFDMPDGVINKELAAGVAKVIEMLDDDESTAS